MENVKKLLDAVKAKTGATSDYRLAKTLELPDQRISDYYKGNRVPDEFACLKIAEALDMPLAQVIATVKAEAEKDEKRREEWRSYLKKLGGMAASVALALSASVIFFVTASPAEAAPLLISMPVAICIMSILAGIAEVKTKLRSVGFPSTFGAFVLQIHKVPAY